MKPSGPATIIAPTASLPWMCELSKTSLRRGQCEDARHPGQKLRLRGRLGHAAGKRLAGIDRGMLGEAALLAALRHGDLHLAAGALGQSLGDEGAFGRLMR